MERNVITYSMLFKYDGNLKHCARTILESLANTSGEEKEVKE